MTKEFLDMHDLTDYLGVKKSTLYGIVENGDLPHYRIGRLIRFRRDEVDAWIEGHRRERIAPEKKAKDVLKGVRNPKIDVDKVVKKVIEEVKNSGYTLDHGKPNRIKGLRKEVEDGTL